MDQFEELFTLNDEETQGRFAEHLAGLSKSGVHVLLSMRDDFLIHCHTQPALAPVFKDLTPVLPLEGAALRKALVEPARAAGYRFEDEALVTEILTEVSRERGALPLLGFAASKLWEKRDRVERLLTREAYLSIGGVAGALAKHAEETLSAIGAEHEPIVRETFRNLVSGQGTRVPLEKDALLSVFPDREVAAGVLGKLIDARLLMSAGNDVEIIHESLLTAWPRLVRWQTQDADAAVFRDQLRQTARLWEERGRPTELLWTGAPYKEFELWRERYPGGLTASEEAYARAMVAKARRQRTRQLTAVAIVIGLLLGVVVVVSSLWRRAVLEAEHREAAQILALGRLELEDNPTAALAYALASLERADSDEARRFALEALWHEASAIVLPDNLNYGDFSPDGKWLATGGSMTGVRLWSMEGGPPKALGEPDGVPPVQFSPGGDFLAAGGSTSARFWSIPGGRELRKVELEGPTGFVRRGSHLLSLSTTFERAEAVRDWSDPEGDPDVLALHDFSDLVAWDVDSSGDRLITGRGHGVYSSSLRDPSAEGARLVGEHEAKVVRLASHPTASRIVSGDETGEIRIWNMSGTSGHLERTFQAPAAPAHLDPTNSWMILGAGGPHSTSDVAYVWDLTGPPDAEPRALRNGNVKYMNQSAIHPEGLWLFTGHGDFGVLWPLQGKYPRVLRGQPPPHLQLAFVPDGKGLLSTSQGDGTLRFWALSPEGGDRSGILMDVELGLEIPPAVDPTGKFVLTGSQYAPSVYLVPIEGGKPREMPGFTKGEGWALRVAWSPDGRLVAASAYDPTNLRIWDIRSAEVLTLDTSVPDEGACWAVDFAGSVDSLEFLADGRLLTFGAGGIRVWDVERATSRQIRACKPIEVESTLTIDRERRRVLVHDENNAARLSALSLLDVETWTFREITSHGNRVSAVAFDPTGTIVVTGDFDGVVRVGPVTGEEPHLLFGHTLEISSVAVSPDGKWIASGSQDGTIRLWPTPEGQPFHTLPYQEILQKIRVLTNLRVVRDDASEGGHRIEIGRFPGWKTPPSW